MKTLIIIIVTGLFIGFGSYAFFGGSGLDDADAEMLVYESAKYGIKFSYPDRYHLEEKDFSSPAREHFSVILTEDSEENRLVREGNFPGREGPVAITFDLYQSAEDFGTLEWVLGHSSSNYKLSDGTYDERIVSGKPTVYYSWDGLYRANNVVVVHGDYIISIVATYLTPSDEILADFKEILDTISFH